MALRRLRACFSRRAQASIASTAQARAVEEVLCSRSWPEVLQLLSSRGDVDASTLDLEQQDLTDRWSDTGVLEAFVCIGVEVHPFRNQHSDSTLALQWAADAFVNLRDQHRRTSALSTEWGTWGPVRDRACSTGADEALRLFGEAVSTLHERLSLHDVVRGGVGKKVSDALLHGMHLLHLRPHMRDDRRGSRDRSLLDSVLAGALAANWLLFRMVRLLTRPSQRQRTEWVCSTTVAALGGVAFTGATRIQRMLTDDGASTTGLGTTAEPLEPCVRCPLCRIVSPAGRAIQDVRAGDSVPCCCVCTEQKANVCLLCGHLCLCGDCFKHLPRSTAVAA
mmetsp:Transcript_56991/g.144654  ORF Transcript_56991/g.144654 Transcript_56991/m.144654 type:complete len:336 (-) Transcript_56991:271-1278(-)